MNDLTGLLTDFCAPLQRTKRWGGGIRASCPCDGHARGDRNPSLVVWCGEKRILAKCYVGHGWEDVYAALGYNPDDWTIDATDDRPAILSVYTYTDADDQPLYRVIRYVPKRFSQERWVNGDWEPKLGDVARVLYRLSEVITADKVIVVEGEKDVESLRSLGYVATTAAGGAQNWKPEYGRWLEGKEVVVIPDSDEQGMRYAQAVKASAPHARIVALDGHKDITDLIYAAGDAATETIEAMLGGETVEVDAVEWAPRRTADSWMFSHSEGIDLLITQITPSSRGLHAWVEMRWRGTVPAPGLIVAARFDLMGSRTVGSMVGRVADAGIDPKTPDWRHLLQTAVYDVIQDYLSGPDAVDLAKVTPNPATFVIRPLVGAVGSTSLVGAGGVGKSMLALAAACAVASGDGEWIGMKVMRPGHALIVDWEADADTHANRLDALRQGTGLDIEEGALTYIDAEAPLAMWAPALARRVAKLEAQLVVIDSVMLARGGEAAASDTIAFFAALRALGCPTLLVDHQSRDAIDNDKGGSYGSVINDNTARLRWLIRGDEYAIRVRNVKANNFGRLPTINLRLDKTVVGDQLRSAQWVHVDPPPPTGSLTDQILETIRDHPAGLHASDLAQKLAADANTVRATCHRLGNQSRISQVDGRWFPLADPY